MVAVLVIYFKSFVMLHHILTTGFEESWNNMQPQLASFSCGLIPYKQSWQFYLLNAMVYASIVAVIKELN